MADDRLAGRIAIVTGAASGIGRAIALRMLACGARVVAADIDAERGSELAVEAGEGLRFVPLDVTDEGQWAAVFAETERVFGVPHILVNNAGYVLLKDLAETSLAEWRAQNAVNLDGTFLGTRCAIKAMSGIKGGRIINIASINALAGVHTAPAYCASKGGVTAFTKATALYCAHKGFDITVNSVHPGYVETPLIEDLAGRFGGDRERVMSSLARTQPLGRLGQPDDIAEGVIYLASEAGRFVTGSELVIDGGYLAQ